MRSEAILSLFVISALFAFSYQGAHAGFDSHVIITDVSNNECSQIGDWNPSTKTCTLHGDYSEGITISVESNDITIDGNGNSLSGVECSGIGIQVESGKSNATIKNITIQGYQHGILFSNVDSSTIMNTVSTNNCGHGLDMENGSDGNTVEDSIFDDNDNDNIIVRDSNGNSFTNVTAHNSSTDDGLDLERSNNNTFDDLKVNNSDNGIEMDNSDGNTFDGGEVKSNRDEGIKLDDSDNNTIKNLSIESNDDDGIEFYDSSGNTISDNTIKFNEDEGIDLDELNTFNTFENNTVMENDSTGIELSYEDNNNTFTGNTVSKNGDEGIELQEMSSGNTFVKNILRFNVDSAFDIEDDSDNNTFSCNTATNNGGAGFELEHSSSGNVIFKNQVEQNGEGIGLYSGASANEITNNNIINNDYQIFDDDGGANTLSPNYWGNGIPSQDSNPLQSPVDLTDCENPDLPESEPVLLGSDNQNNIFEIDTNTGAATLVGTLPMIMEEYEYYGNPYGTEVECTSDTNGPLCYFQATNGGFTIQQFDYPTINRIGMEVFDGAAFNGLEYVNGDLYGTSITGPCGPSELSILNPSTGTSQLIGLTGVGPISGLAYDTTNKIMYGVSGCGGGGEGPGDNGLDIRTLNGEPNPSASKLYTINLQTGNATMIANTGVSNLGGLQFGPDGELYGGGNNNDGGNLYVINTVTGTATLVGPTGFQGITGLTLILGNPNLPDKIRTSGGGGMNNWDTRPTFGISHEDRANQVVENGFRFNTNEYMLTDNHHTDFAEQSVDIGTVNSFSATVYADKKLKIQEFLFGIPNVGEAHLAELGVEVWYDRDGEIEDVKVVQKSDVIDADTVSVSHEKVKCLSTDAEAKCDTTTVSMTFLEPLMDKVMAIKAIDYALRDQRTFLNEGFDISGESLNPMYTKMIPSNLRDQGLLKVTQVAKYSPYWEGEDGRTFEMNSFGSFKQINKSFERFQDTGNAFSRMHSGFGGIIAYEQDRATDLFDSSKLISEIPESFAYIYPQTGERLTDEMLQEMQLQAEIAQGILDEMDKQDRHY